MPEHRVTELAAFTCGRTVPSARLRVRQHLPALRQHGIETREYYPRVGSAHPTSTGIARFPWLLSQLKQRNEQIKNAHRYDVALLQRQLIATINTFEYRIAGPRILDVDDAIWLTCRFNSVDRLAGTCESVICGNDFIADHFASINPNIHIIPTAVDTDAWAPYDSKISENRPTIGWIGTHGNYKYLYAIEDSLMDVMRELPDARILIVSDVAPQFTKIPPSRIDYHKWSEENEVSEVQSMSIGIMPIADAPWARGKCSCKMLQYMACGVPAIASPVGTNIQVAARGGAILAGSREQWTEAMLHLLQNEASRNEIGVKGRSVVVQHYSSRIIAADLANIIKKCA